MGQAPAGRVSPVVLRAGRSAGAQRRAPEPPEVSTPRRQEGLRPEAALSQPFSDPVEVKSALYAVVKVRNLGLGVFSLWLSIVRPFLGH
jgi:hypothetical protein